MSEVPDQALHPFCRPIFGLHLLLKLYVSLSLSFGQSLHKKKKDTPPKIEVFVCLFLTVSGYTDFFLK